MIEMYAMRLINARWEDVLIQLKLFVWCGFKVAKVFVFQRLDGGRGMWGEGGRRAVSEEGWVRKWNSWMGRKRVILHWILYWVWFFNQDNWKWKWGFRDFHMETGTQTEASTFEVEHCFLVSSCEKAEVESKWHRGSTMLAWGPTEDSPKPSLTLNVWVQRCLVATWHQITMLEQCEKLKHT